MNQNRSLNVVYLKKAVEGQEQLRSTLGDEVVDIALQVLREKVTELENQSVTAQHKQVTILFADLCNFTALTEHSEAERDREYMFQIMSVYFDKWRKAIANHGGVVEKFIGDAVMAVFGIPTSGEKDPENAIRAALEMKKSLVELNATMDLSAPLEMRVGIHTGSVLINILDQHIGDFTAVGDTVNYASRLESNAPTNGIYISHSTYLHVKGIFDIEQVKNKIQVKGKKEPIQAYLVESIKETKFQRFTWFLMDLNNGEKLETKTVGRQREMLLLQDKVKKMIDSKKMTAVTVIGEAGYGKSRLLYDLESWLDHGLEERVFFFRGRVTQQNEHRNYRLFYNILAYRFKIRESDNAQMKKEKLQKGIVEVFVDQAEKLGRSREIAEQKGLQSAYIIGHVLGIGNYSDQPEIQQILSRSEANQLWNLNQKYLIEFFQAATYKYPVTLLLEDIQWADTHSLSLLRDLMEQCFDYPITIISVARPTLFDKFSEWRVGEEVFHSLLELKPLADQYVEELIFNILRHVPDLPEVLVKKIVKHAEGNPFYVEELIKMLIENGVIIEEHPKWTINLDKLSKELVPTTLTGVLQARLDRLPKPERRLLQMASAVGRIFWDSTINYLAERTDTQELLDSLVQKRLIYFQPDSRLAGSRQYIFRHIMHQVVYNSLLRQDRQSYHNRMVDWIKEVYGNQAYDLAETIADHYAKANNYLQAGIWYYQAAKQEQKKSSLGTAIEYYTNALFYLPKTEVETQLYCLEGLGQTYRWQGHYEKAIKAFEQMRILAQELGQPQTEIRALIELSHMRNNQGAYMSALSAIEAAESLAVQYKNMTELARVFSQKGWVFLKLKKYQSAFLFGRKALQLSQDVYDQRQIAHNLNLVGTIEYIRGNFGKATMYIQESLQLFQKLQDNNGVALMLNQLGEIAYSRGDSSGAGSLYQQALSLAYENENVGAQMVYLTNLASAEIILNKCNDATEHLEKVLAMPESEQWNGLAKAMAYLAESLLCEKSYERAAEVAIDTLYLSDQATNELIYAQEKLSSQTHNEQEQISAGIAWRVLGQVAIVLEREIEFRGKRFAIAQCFNKSLAALNQLDMLHQQIRTLEIWSSYIASTGKNEESQSLKMQVKELKEKMLV